MILTEFAKFIQEYDDELMAHKVTPLELLHKWVFKVINKIPKSDAEKIVHHEILLCQNETGDYLIVGKSDSGRKLVTTLINFADSYKNYNHAKWINMLEQKYHH